MDIASLCSTVLFTVNLSIFIQTKNNRHITYPLSLLINTPLAISSYLGIN